MTRYGSHTESRMRETCTYGSMRGSRRKTAKSVLRVVEDRAGVPDNKGRSALLYTLLPLPSYATRDAKEIAKLFVIQTSIDFLKYE